MMMKGFFHYQKYYTYKPRGSVRQRWQVKIHQHMNTEHFNGMRTTFTFLQLIKDFILRHILSAVSGEVCSACKEKDIRAHDIIMSDSPSMNLPSHPSIYLCEVTEFDKIVFPQETFPGGDEKVEVVSENICQTCCLYFCWVESTAGQQVDGLRAEEED